MEFKGCCGPESSLDQSLEGFNKVHYTGTVIVNTGGLSGSRGRLVDAVEMRSKDGDGAGGGCSGKFDDDGFLGECAVGELGDGDIRASAGNLINPRSMIRSLVYIMDKTHPLESGEEPVGGSSTSGGFIISVVV